MGLLEAIALGIAVGLVGIMISKGIIWFAEQSERRQQIPRAYRRSPLWLSFTTAVYAIMGSGSGAIAGCIVIGGAGGLVAGVVLGGLLGALVGISAWTEWAVEDARRRRWAVIEQRTATPGAGAR